MAAKSKSGLTPEETHAARVAGASVRTTLETRQQMLDLHLQRVSYGQIAKTVGHDIGTVRYWVRKQLEEALAESKENNRITIERILLGLELQARDARAGYHRAIKDGDHAAAARYLGLERQADETRLKYGPVRDDEANQAAGTSKATVEGIVEGLTESFTTADLTAEQQETVVRTMLTLLGD